MLSRLLAFKFHKKIHETRWGLLGFRKYGVTKKYGGAVFNGTVKSYQYKEKNKYPIFYWVFFDEDQTSVEFSSKNILSLLTPLSVLVDD